VGDLDDLFQSVIEVGKVENPYFRESGVIVFYAGTANRLP
jgi:hypothetical protein